MKVSVITVVKNNVDVIDVAIHSVLSQKNVDIEYVIIDGNSSDGTWEKIQGYGNRIHKTIHEPDEGVYHALNKGIQLASGDIIALLHSDDFYAHPYALSIIVRAFENDNIDAVYSNLYYVSPKNTKRIVRVWSSGKFNKQSFSLGWMPPHPAFFVRRKVYEKYGLFRGDLKFSADYDLMLRFILKCNIRLAYIPKFLVVMRNGGASNRSLRNRIKANLEDRKAWRINEIKAHWFTLLLKPIRKIFQYTIVYPSLIKD